MTHSMLPAIRFPFVLFSALLLGVGLTGCDSNGSTDDPLTAQVRFMHASADAGAITVVADGEEVVSGVTFNRRPNVNPTVTARQEVPIEGTIEVQNNAGEVLTTIDGSQFEADAPFLVVITGSLAAGEQTGRTTPQALVLRDDVPEPGADEIGLRLIHGAAGAPTIDVFWVPPGDEPSADNQVVSGVSFLDTFPASPPGDFDVRTVPDEGRILTVPTPAGPLQLPVGTQEGASLPTGRVITAVAIDTEPGAGFPVAAIVQVD